MTIDELREYSPADVRDMDRLMHELSATSFCSEEKLAKVVADCNSHVYVLREVLNGSECSDGLQPVLNGSIVATATLCVSHTPEFTLGGVEAVVTLSSCRGKGYGRLLMEHMIQEAKRFGCVKLHLTSNPRRVAANVLYQKLGFQLYNTNYYEYDIK